jgi:hypothetical protein
MLQHAGTKVPLPKRRLQIVVWHFRVDLQQWAPREVNCICCFLTKRLLTNLVTIDSTTAVLILSPCQKRVPFGMTSWLLRM